MSTCVWRASPVTRGARRNTLQFAKGKKQTSITKKSGKVERKLRDSIQFSVERDSGIPEAVSFKVPIHGIWREWAVGYGQPRVPGKYVNPHPRIRRSMADWLDEPIDRNAERLLTSPPSFGVMNAWSIFSVRRMGDFFIFAA